MPEEPRDSTPDPSHRLSDGREDIGDSLARPIPREDRALGEDFSRRNSYYGPGLGEEFADPSLADERAMGEAFADPNSIDDIKIGKSFEQTNSSAKKNHRPIKEAVEAPFKKPGSKKILYLFIAGVHHHRHHRSDRRRNSPPRAQQRDSRKIQTSQRLRARH